MGKLTRRWAVLGCGLALAAAASTAGLSGDKQVDKIVAELDAKYQALFADLALTKDGTFGIGRVEVDNIKTHGRKPSRPTTPGFLTNVAIFGNKGKPLSAQGLERRYTKDMNGVTHRRDKGEGRAEYELALKAVKEWSKGGRSPLKAVRGDVAFEARPVLLSKKECVDCHKGMKRGQPVAVMVYAVAPTGKDRP
ncbi:MAG: hypothetical protein JST30_08845 [Armatimonadetes bacterium]|nr:hypothetical protein [Armatimonadota bacterium]